MRRLSPERLQEIAQAAGQASVIARRAERERAQQLAADPNAGLADYSIKDREELYICLSKIERIVARRTEDLQCQVKA